MQESDLLNLYDQYADIVYRLAVSYIGSAQDSEDIVQTVFLKLLDGTASPLPGKERAYLTRITINCCKDFLRSFRRKRTLSIDETFIFRCVHANAPRQEVTEKTIKEGRCMKKQYIRMFDAVHMAPAQRTAIRSCLSEHTTRNISPKKRKRFHSLTLVAILLILAMALVGFAFGKRILRSISLLGGGIIEEFIDESGNSTVAVPTGFSKAPVIVTGEQIFYILDDTYKNITEYCSPNTYFRHDFTDDEGILHIILVGGSADQLGWAEFVLTDEGIMSNATLPGSEDPQWLIQGLDAYPDL